MLLERCYKVLELELGASADEVHQGYKDLAFVWHPDRFPNHPRLQQRANEKLQQLNEAHEQLRSLLKRQPAYTCDRYQQEVYPPPRSTSTVKSRENEAWLD